ncbi:MAG: GNAT family N-acetyltransferase [Deltaproteobacteria bacterium]|nr:MAG: GNAT family N-acetyltransferase [Deltaproteobacteria bacterium]
MEFEVSPFSRDHFEVVDGLNAESEEPSPFLTAPYMEAWDHCFSAEREKVSIFAREGGRIVGAGIFYRRTSPDCYFLLGGKSLSDRLGFAVKKGREEEFVRSLVRWMREEGEIPYPLVVNNLSGDWRQFRAFEEISREDGRILINETDVAPRVDLPSTFEEYLQGLSKKDRHELRRKLRRCRDHLGEVQVVEGGRNGDLENDLEEFVRLHRLSHPDKANFWRGRRREFFSLLARNFSRQGWLRLFFLFSPAVGGNVSALFVFDYNGDYLLYNSGFDPAFRKASPGLAIVAETIRTAIAEQKRRYDFLRGGERYKFDLGGVPRSVFRVELVP